MLKTIIASLGLLVAASAIATPALAVPYCNGGDSVAPTYTYDSRGRLQRDDTQQLESYKDLLQARGIDATSVEKWNGCLRAFVRNANGVGENMQFFDPSSLQQVF